MILFNNELTEEPEHWENVLETGLSIYEVVRIFNKQPIFLQDNILRLQNSTKKSNINIDILNLHIKDKLHKLIALNNIHEGNLKYVLHFTNGHIDEYVYQIPHSYPTEEAYRQGVDTICHKAIRENPEVKYLNPKLREATNELIQKKHVYEILLIDNEGYITEGSRSNIFFIKGDTFYTAPTCYVLPGTSRKRVVDICKEHHFGLVENRIAYTSLKEYDAAFISGTSPLVLPIRTIDGIHFDPGNKRLREMMDIYFSMLNNFLP